MTVIPAGPAQARKGRRWKIVRQDAMTHIKQAIRADLEATGMTQADLAAYCGLSQKHVSQVLTGNVAGTFGTLAAMATACGLTITAVRPDTTAPDHYPGGASMDEDVRDERWRAAAS